MNEVNCNERNKVGWLEVKLQSLSTKKGRKSLDSAHKFNNFRLFLFIKLNGDLEMIKVSRLVVVLGFAELQLVVIVGVNAR